MSRKIYKAGDLIVVRDNKTTKGFWIPPQEMRDVLNQVNEVGYALYSLYRTYPFAESDEITDEYVGELIGWTTRKVQKYRLILSSEKLLLKVRYGSNEDGVTRLFIGRESVALYEAGLPADVQDVKALNKLKREFNIKTTEDLLNNIGMMSKVYQANPEKYI